MFKNIFKLFSKATEMKISKTDIVYDIGEFPHYYEITQNNPLLWKLMYQRSDGLFEEQAGWMKCKDFFNDLVARRHQDKTWNIYGFTNDVKFNEQGMYMLLNNITNKDLFLKNMAVMNKRLQEDLGCVVDVLDTELDQKCIILIPNELWASTYRISMVTACIRLCNYDVEYKKWEDLWKQGAPSYVSEGAFTEQAKTNARKNGFKVAEKYNEYWFYCGEGYNSKAYPDMQGGTVHNNGVSSWSTYVGVMEVA